MVALGKKTYAEQRRTMLCGLHDLYRRQITLLGRHTSRQRHLWQAERPLVLLVRGPRQLKPGHHDHGVVLRRLAKAKVDVHERRLVSRVPARLDGEGAAADGPVGSVSRYAEAATCGEGGSCQPLDS